MRMLETGRNLGNPRTAGTSTPNDTMTRRCSHCGHNGHNSRTCPERGVRLFGVRLADDGMRKSVSMGNLNNYSASSMALPSTPEHSDNGGTGQDGYLSDGCAPISTGTRERKKGIPWTEEEHRMFLLGLHKLGKGDWRGISRNFVQTRTPTQVASHAQKYFIRQNNLNKRKRRSSLFDIGTEEVSVGMGRSMSTPSLPSLSEDSTSPLHSQSSGSQGALYSPPTNYDLSRSQSYPSAMPGTGMPQPPAVPTYGMPTPQMSRAPGPMGMHKMRHGGSSGNLEMLVERTSAGQGLEHHMAGVYVPSRAMGPPGMSMGAGMGMGMGMGMGYGMGMHMGGQRGGVGTELSFVPSRDEDHLMKDQQDEEAQEVWKRKAEVSDEGVFEGQKGTKAFGRAKPDPAMSHRMGHEMMLRMTHQMAQRMAEGRPQQELDETSAMMREAEREGYGHHMEMESGGRDRAAADRDQNRAQPGHRGQWYWGHEASALPFSFKAVQGEDIAGRNDGAEARVQSGGPQWVGSYGWGPQQYSGLGFFMGHSGPGPYSPYFPYSWSTFGPSGPPPYAMPPGLGGPPLVSGLGPSSAPASPSSHPTQPKVLRPTASVPTCPIRFAEKGLGSSPNSGDKPGLGISSPAVPSALTLRLLESSSSRQSAFQSRPAYGSNLSPSQADVGNPPISVV